MTAMRKKIDSRIRTLVENCVKTRHRSLFVIVGDKGREQVVNLHYMLSKAAVKARPSVLWCYKKDLHFSRCAAGSIGLVHSRERRLARNCRATARMLRGVLAAVQRICVWHLSCAMSAHVLRASLLYLSMSCHA